MTRLAIILALVPAFAASENLFHEDFSTTAYMDELNTTAVWDTVAQELRLPRLPALAVTVPTASSTIRLAISGNIAYLANYNYGLEVMDFSNPLAPVSLASVSMPGTVRSVVVSGDLALLAANDAGIVVVDISDPASPSVIGSCSLGGYARDLVAGGDLVYVSVEQGEALKIVDISDQANPFIVGELDRSYSRGIDLCGPYVYWAGGIGGLSIIDVSDPSAPIEVGDYDTPGSAWNVSVVGGHAYVADGYGGLQIIDVSDPALPSLAGSLGTPGEALNVAVSGDMAYVADGEHGGLQAIDIANPSVPVWAGEVPSIGYACGVEVFGNHALVACHDDGIAVVKISTISDPQIVSQIALAPAIPQEIVIEGDLLAIANYRLFLYDISDPLAPAELYAMSPDTSVTDVILDGGLAYLSTSVGLLVSDVSDPSSPSVIGSLAIPPGALAKDGNLVAATDDPSLRLVDVTNPTNPILLSAWATTRYMQDVALAGDVAYVVTDGYDGTGSFLSIDISDPTAPVLLDEWIEKVMTHVTLYGDYAYVTYCYYAYPSGQAVAFSISDPSSLQRLVINIWSESSAGRMVTSGNRAYWTFGDDGLKVIDLENPAYPAEIDELGFSTPVSCISISGDYAYLTGRYSDLMVARIRQRETAELYARAYSQVVATTPYDIPWVHISSTQSGGVDWLIRSSFTGSGWSGSSETGWARAFYPHIGNMLRWQSFHEWAPDAIATAYDLTLQWTYVAAPILSIDDVPDDQGGWARLSFTRSGYDFIQETEIPVSGYWIHQRVDDPTRQEQILTEGRVLSESPAEGFPAASFDEGCVLEHGDGTFLLGGPGNIDELPEGTWEVIASVPAMQQDEYLVRVPTLADSTIAEGMAWTVLLTTAHTTTPSIWFASLPDSGYSVDNIAPGVPQGFAVDHEPYNVSLLSWDPCQDEDFQFFRVYRGEEEDFPVGPETQVHETAETTWTDEAGGPDFFYKLGAVDQAGNESDPASPGTVVVTDDPPAPRFALGQNYPNPFNPSTTITLALHEAGEYRLGIYDLSGRLVREFGESLPAGEHRIVWDGRDAAGQPVSSGVYLYRLEAGQHSATRRMLLLK